MSLSFDGKTVVVTGAGGSIGRSYALAYAQRGANVVVNDLNGDAADRVVQEILSAGGKAVKDSHSVTDGPAIIQTALDTYNEVHILINNAGTVHMTKFEDFSDKQWDDLVAVHLQGTISLTRAAWPIFIAQRSGHIINTTSAVGLYGHDDNCAYCSAKAGIIAFTKTLAKEGEHFGIKANAIAPFADSKMTEMLLPEDVRKAMSPDFIAPLVLALTHEGKGPGVTGRLFEVASGWIAEIKSVRTKGILVQADKPLTPDTVRERWNELAPDFADLASQDTKDLRYDGLTVLVTGATTEPGRAYAKLFAGLGANVVVSDSDDAQVRSIVQEITKDGGKAAASVAPAEAADSIVEAAIKEYGTVHVLVANGDVSSAGILAQLTDKEWDDAVKGHLRSAFKVVCSAITKACWPIFKKQNYGRIVYTTSTAGLHGAENKAPFATANGAVLGMARAVSYEGKAENILLNVVLPSADTEKLDAAAPAVVGFLASKANTGATRALIETSASWAGQLQWQRTGGHSFFHDVKLTPEAVIERWEKITNFDDGRATNPSSVAETFQVMFANFTNFSGKA